MERDGEFSSKKSKQDKNEREERQNQGITCWGEVHCLAHGYVFVVE